MSVTLTPHGENLARKLWDWWREEGTLCEEGRSWDDLTDEQRDRVRLALVHANYSFRKISYPIGTQ